MSEEYYEEKVLRFRVVKQYTEEHPHYGEIKKDNPESLNEWWLVSSHTSYNGAVITKLAIEENGGSFYPSHGYRFKVVDRGSESVIKRSVW